MARTPEEQSIKQRGEIASHFARGLARNPDYQRDIEALIQRGYCFDNDGFPDWQPPGRDLHRLVEVICRRSGLKYPVLPSVLRALSLDGAHHLFPYVQRAVLRPRSRADLRALGRDRPIRLVTPGSTTLSRGATPVPARGGSHRSMAASRVPRDWSERVRRQFTITLIEERRLSERHHDYTDCWRVYDRVLAGWTHAKVAEEVWPRLDPEEAQQRVYRHNKRAKQLIIASYPQLPPGE